MLSFPTRTSTHPPHRHIVRACLFILWALAACSPLARAGDNAAARAEIAERRLKWHSKDGTAWETLVRARLEMGDVERAEKALEKWSKLETRPEKVSPIIHLLRGHVARKRDHPGDALIHWKNALIKEPGNVEALDAVAWAEAAQNNWREAADAVSRLLSIENNPSLEARRVGYYVQRANWFLRIRDWARAEADVRTANELDATNAGVKELLPLLESRNQWQPSLEALDKDAEAALSTTDKATVLLKRAVFLLQHAFLIQAFEDAKSAYDLTPDRMDAQFWKSFCAWRNEKPQHVAPFQPKSEEYMEWILEEQQLRKVEELGRSRDSERQAEHLLDLKQPYMALHLTREVEGSLAKVKALRALGEQVQARKAAHRALELAPDSPEALLEMAEIEFENGNITEALSAVDRVIKSNNKPARARATALQQTAMRLRGTP
jgi:tetratricopeptide (TPR) repeat protein